ncbi:MAG: orotidine-5'-phosphate decarboxylase [Chlorobi bacterium]|nr:orotidine-5'-phosphate decarboxylase [Chlorobiota bacterium]
MNFTEKLHNVVNKNQSLLCVGLDIAVERIPAHIRGRANPALEFARNIVEATADLVCAYKLNFAFYEAMGAGGWETLRQVLEAIPEDVVTIGDAKRGDIGNTSEMYARAIFEDLGFDAATAAPFMGRDSVQPFLDRKEKCTFFLTLTSNPGSRDFLYLDVDGKPFYAKVAETIMSWNEYGNCGFVVGATHPEELAGIRATVGDSSILVPGIGAQGGSVEASVRAGCNERGEGAIFNVSRGVIYASDGEDFAAAARNRALEIRDEINKHRRG